MVIVALFHSSFNSVTGSEYATRFIKEIIPGPTALPIGLAVVVVVAVLTTVFTREVSPTSPSMQRDRLPSLPRASYQERSRKEIMGVEGNKLETGVAHIRPGEGGRSLWAMGEMVTCKITSDQTSGAYSLFEITTRPGEGPPPHVQHWEDEAFYVLEGEYEFLDGGRTIRAGVGSLIYVRSGNLHAHKNVGEKPGRMLVIQTPGGTHERYFEELAENAAAPFVSEDSPDIETVSAIATRYGIEILSPRSG